MSSPTVDSLPFTDDPEANRLLVEDPFALLIGFTLDQQVPLQKAFSGPLELRRRIGPYDAKRIASMDADELDGVFRRPPALHRFPSNMAKRTRELCAARRQPPLCTGGALGNLRSTSGGGRLACPGGTWNDGDLRLKIANGKRNMRAIRAMLATVRDPAARAKSGSLART